MRAICNTYNRKVFLIFKMLYIRFAKNMPQMSQKPGNPHETKKVVWHFKFSTKKNATKTSASRRKSR